MPHLYLVVFTQRDNEFANVTQFMRLAMGLGHSIWWLSHICLCTSTAIYAYDNITLNLKMHENLAALSG